MPITTHTVWQGGAQGTMVGFVREVHDFFRSNGSQEVTFSRLHTGPHLGNYLLTHRFADWEAFGRAQAVWATDPWYRSFGGRVREVASIGERSLHVSLELGLTDPSPTAAPGPRVTTLVRYIGGPEPEMVAAVQEIHPWFLRHGIDQVRFHRTHFGPDLGHYLLELGHPNWEAFGRAQAARERDPWFHEHGARVLGMSRVGGRVIAVDLPLS